MGTKYIVDGRPNRSPDRLATFCETVELPGLTDPGNGQVTLSDADVDVKQSALVNHGANANQTEVVDLAKATHPRTNEFAALSGYQRTSTTAAADGWELFERMRSYGLSPSEYFRAGTPPLLI